MVIGDTYPPVLRQQQRSAADRPGRRQRLTSGGGSTGESNALWRLQGMVHPRISPAAVRMPDGVLLRPQCRGVDDARIIHGLRAADLDPNARLARRVLAVRP